MVVGCRQNISPWSVSVQTETLAAKLCMPNNLGDTAVRVIPLSTWLWPSRIGFPEITHGFDSAEDFIHPYSQAFSVSVTDTSESTAIDAGNWPLRF